MMRKWGNAIGGPSAITIWSWIITLPLAVVLGVSGGLILALPLGPWLLAVVATQVALILPLALARVTYLSDRVRRPRPVAALVTFAALGALRSLLLLGFAQVMGVTPTGNLASSWLIAGSVYGVVVLSAIAIVVDGVRQHRAALQRLDELRASLAQTRSLDETRRAELADVFYAEVQTSVSAALDGLRVTGQATRADVSAALRAVAETVVRPLSHRLASDDTWEVPLALEPPPPPRLAARVRELIGAMRPAQPILLVALIELLALPYLWQRVGVAYALLNLVVGSAALLGSSWLIGRAWPRRLTTIPALGALFAAYAVAGGFASAAIDLAAHAVGLSAPFFWTTIAFVPIAAFAISLLAAITARRRVIEADLTSTLAEEAQETARLRESLARMRSRLARVLHSTVQGEFIATALALAADQDASVQAVDGELDALSQRVRERIRTIEAPAISAEDRMHDLIDLWSDVLVIEVRAAPDAWATLDADPALVDRAVDVVAEGLTNAVRHGTGRTIELSITALPDGIDLRIGSPGVLAASAQPSLGMQTVAESADAWELVQVDDRVNLVVSLRSG